MPICTLLSENSMLDEWKKCSYQKEVLEKYCINMLGHKGEMFDFVPSSNPCSQIDMEEAFALEQTVMFEEEKARVECVECWKTDIATVVKNNFEDFFLPEEAIFDDYLAKYRQHLPCLIVLIRRSKFIPVEDPLASWHKICSAQEQLFRYSVLQNPEIMSNFCKEDFHVLSLGMEEHLMLPHQLEFHDNSIINQSCVANLLLLVDLSPEPVAYEQKDCASSYCSHQENELEVLFTPPPPPVQFCCSELPVNFIVEEMSPARHNLIITNTPRDILENLVFDPEIYHLLLKVPCIQHPFHHLTIFEIKDLICANLETMEDPASVPLEWNWWHELGLNVSFPHVESLKENHSDESVCNSPISNKFESFQRICVLQNEKLMDEHRFSREQRATLPKSVKLPETTNHIHAEIKPLCSSSQKEFNMVSEDTANIINPDDYFVDRQECNTLCSLKSVSSTDNETENLPLDFSNLCETSRMNPSEICESSSSNSGISEHQKNSSDVSDLLNDFIMLRTRKFQDQSDICVEKNSPTKERGRLKTSSPSTNVDSNLQSSVTDDLISEETIDCPLTSICIPPSDSQIQAYQILKEEASPVLNKLVALNVPACLNWEFSSVSFDYTRFLLKQQENVVTEVSSMEDKDITLFKLAALFHILVTLRDLILMCTFDTAIGYLYKAKEMYRSALGGNLDVVWRKLRIVQYIRERNQEVNPKLIVLQTELLQWMEKCHQEDRQFKVLIITKMNQCDMQNIILSALCHTKGKLEDCSCIIINNKYIGSDFPWSNFSLVMEYDGTDYWQMLCQDIKLQYISLKTSIQNSLFIEEKHANNRFENMLGKIQIPYVFLTSEGLISNPEILQLMESRYNITFIEKSSSVSLQLFGKTEKYAVITVDVCTAILLQNLEELKYENSSENVILRLVALSMQYSCCWLILHAEEKISPKWVLSIMNFDSIYYIYICVEQTGLFIRKISDYTLISYKGDPYMWLDRSWLTILTSEEEECLLAFPCINPMVAQLMLHVGTSLQCLLSGTIDQLQELMPDVPSKVIKHFTDITSRCQKNTSDSSLQPVQRPLQQRKDNCLNLHNVQSEKNFYTTAQFIDGKAHNTSATKPVTHLSLLKASISDCSLQCTSSCHSKTIQPKVHTGNIFDTKYSMVNNAEIKYNLLPKKYTTMLFNSKTHSTNPEPAFPSVMLGQESVNNDSFGIDTNIKSNVCNQNQSSSHLMETLHHSLSLNQTSHKQDFDHLFEIKGCLSQNPSFRAKERFFTELLCQKPPQNSINYPSDKQKVTNISHLVSPENPKNWHSLKHQAPEKSDLSHLSKLNFNFIDDFQLYKVTGEFCGRKASSVANTSLTDSEKSKGIKLTQLSQPKRRKLSYEKIPGRSDGQTRLKFF
ncbi:hypothetical protein GDO86_001279 [Hymenochirus boettgeri]|uniref:Shortage in chiasmata 1 n=1 Tax=Hymenochirus boettgeri TaxID=247094 RepID=A0A8T2KKS4_9PIPI|nr:hypothetical protein GDO86_001279 [Hymenochirus boettgeri]